jgi:nucleotide-binding universal stress UspA family protein
MNAPAPILAATDFSAPARHALERAFLIAAETRTPLELMHVVGQGALDGLRHMLGLQAGDVERRILGQAQAGLESLAAELGHLHGVQARVHLSTGTVLRTLLEVAEARAAALLVVGAKGEDYLGRLLLGTTAERLLRRSTRPVLMVRQMPHEAYRRVLVPVDFSPWSAAAIKLASQVAPQAEWVLLHAYEAPFEAKLEFAGVNEADIASYRLTAAQEARTRLDALVDALGLDKTRYPTRVVHGPASRVILSLEQELDCDLIVMGKHGQGMLEELLLGSVTKHVLAESSSDVLVAVA